MSDELPKPTQSQLDYIEYLIDVLERRGRHDTLVYQPTDRATASEMIDSLKSQLGWR